MVMEGEIYGQRDNYKEKVREVAEAILKAFYSRIFFPVERPKVLSLKA